MIPTEQLTHVARRALDGYEISDLVFSANRNLVVSSHAGDVWFQSPSDMECKFQ